MEYKCTELEGTALKWCAFMILFSTEYNTIYVCYLSFIYYGVSLKECSLRLSYHLYKRAQPLQYHQNTKITTAYIALASNPGRRTTRPGNTCIRMRLGYNRKLSVKLLRTVLHTYSILQPHFPFYVQKIIREECYGVF